VCALTAISLAVVSLVLRNLCILCLGTWVVDFILLLLAVKMLRGVGIARVTADVRESWKLHRAWLVAAAAVGLGLIPGTRLVTPNAWGRPAVITSRLTERGRTGADAHLEQGVDAAGHPYMGAPNPKLTIVEYADYQCPHCATAHAEMRELLAKNPRDIRIVHRHFPLDNQCNSLVQRPFHPHACEYAKMAACASLMGKFWQANDYLFEHGREPEPITVESLAQNVSLDPGQLQVCLDTAGAEVVKADIEEGLGLKVQGTPTFVVDGKLYPGRLPDDVLSAFQK
jgi:protein-disulfide isomerase